MTLQTVIVAGNGQSLSRIDPGRVLADDFVIRVNNFVFENRRYLGARVDLALVSGDPRPTPFVFEAMARARDLYDIGAWAGTTPQIARAGRARLGRHGVPERPYDLGGDDTLQMLDLLQAEHRVTPTSGVLAMLLARAMGARTILVAGIDLYQGPQRYTYEPGPQQRALMGDDLGQRAYDTAFHTAEMDRRVIAWLADRPGLTVWRTADVPALNDILDLAPLRAGTPMPVLDKRQITDWPLTAGLYPIHLLRALRWLRRVQRQVWPGLMP
jgi:hypothetical protein